MRPCLGPVFYNIKKRLMCLTINFLATLPLEIYSMWYNGERRRHHLRKIVISLIGYIAISGVNSIAHCISACPEIPSIVSGQQITTGGDMPPYFSGDTISYRCRDGFSSRIVFSDVICVCGGTTSLSWSCTTLDLSQICRRGIT